MKIKKIFETADELFDCLYENRGRLQLVLTTSTSINSISHTPRFYLRGDAIKEYELGEVSSEDIIKYISEKSFIDFVVEV